MIPRNERENLHTLLAHILYLSSRRRFENSFGGSSPFRDFLYAQAVAGSSRLSEVMCQAARGNIRGSAVFCTTWIAKASHKLKFLMGIEKGGKASSRP